MNKEIQLVLEHARSRNEKIPRMLGNHKFFTPRDPVKTEFLRWWSYRAIPKITVLGIENLEEAEGLRQEGYEVVIASNHQSDADHAVKRRGLEEIGYRKFANRLIYSAGIKMDDRWYTRILMDAENSVYIISPFDTKLINRVLDEEKGLGRKLTEKDRQVISEYQKNARSLNRTSLRYLKELVRVRFMPCIYPESTRSRNGLLGEAPREVSVYLTNTDGFVLPIVTNGITESFPPERNFDLAKSLTGVCVEMCIGRPVPISLIRERSRRYFGAKDNPAEVVMAEIAALKPELAPPSKAGYYQQLLTT